MKKQLKLFGWVVSLSFISLVIVFFWMRSMSDLFGDWLAQHSLWIFIVTSLLVISLFAIGVIRVKGLKHRK